MATKHLNRTSSHRTALRRNLAAALIEHGAIRTTEAKAKDVRRFVEKLITIARKGTLHARRLVLARLQDREMFTYDKKTHEYEPDDKTIVQKLFDEIAPRYLDRPGGYTRIIHLAERRIGDAGKQVILQLIEEDAAQGDAGGEGRRGARAARRQEAAADVETETRPAAEEEQTDETPDQTAESAPDEDQTPDAEGEAEAQSDEETQTDEADEPDEAEDVPAEQDTEEDKEQK